MTSSPTRNSTMKHARTLASLVAAGALLAVPATGIAAKPATKGKPTTSKSAKCKALSMPYQVSGTFVSGIADDAATPLVNETSVTLLVTGANHHARQSGEIADQNATKKGVQVKGATMTVTANPDAFTLKLNGYEAPDTPSVGDRVKVSGKVALTRKRCATAGTSTADRYGAVDVRKVTLSDRDADPVPAPVS